MQIKAIRERKKITQNELALKLNVDRTTVTKWETGAGYPKTETLPKLAKVLNCTIDELFSEND